MTTENEKVESVQQALEESTMPGNLVGVDDGVVVNVFQLVALLQEAGWVYRAGGDE